MKILIINKFLYPNGGSETYIFGLGRELQREGHEVQYFGMEHEGRVVGNRAESYTKPMDFHNAGILDKVTYPSRVIYSKEARSKLRVVLEDFAPDVVHLNNINFQITPSVIDEARQFEADHPELYEEKGRKLRILSTAHDYQWICPNHMLRLMDGQLCRNCLSGDYRWCLKNRCIHGSRLRSFLGMREAKFYAKHPSYAMVDAVIAPSAFLAGQLTANPLLTDRIITLHNFSEAPRDLPEKQRGDYVLYFGRFSEEKGVRTFLAAAAKIPEIPFVFAGKGPLEDEVHGENIRNAGFLQGEALTKLIRGARFAVYPSEWYENCPFSVMEAQEYGVPVLASDLGGSHELIRTNAWKGETGTLFRGGDEEDLTEQIRALWNDPARTDAMSRNCAAFVAENYDTPEQYTHKFLAVCRAEQPAALIRKFS